MAGSSFAVLDRRSAEVRSRRSTSSANTSERKSMWGSVAAVFLRAWLVIDPNPAAAKASRRSVWVFDGSRSPPRGAGNTRSSSSTNWLARLRSSSSNHSGRRSTRLLAAVFVLDTVNPWPPTRVTVPVIAASWRSQSASLHWIAQASPTRQPVPTMTPILAGNSNFGQPMHLGLLWKEQCC
jgi:hypothetical protein